MSVCVVGSESDEVHSNMTYFFRMQRPRVQLSRHIGIAQPVAVHRRQALRKEQ